MLLVIAHQTSIITRFGEQVWSEIQELFRAYVAALSAREVFVLVCDDRNSCAEFGLEATFQRTPERIREMILSIRQSLQIRSGTLQFVLLLGGDDHIPFFRVPNPVLDRSIDPDAEI